MKTVSGKTVPGIGYGAMVLEGYYGGVSEEQSLNVLKSALALGQMIDSADAYGNGHNEGLVGQALREVPREEAFIASKFGIVFKPGVPSRSLPTGWGFSLPINASPEYMEKALTDSLERLGTSYIDLWYAHYPDPEVPIQETVKAMERERQRGRIRYLGLSNLSAEQYREASGAGKIDVVQYEYSLWRREAEKDLLPLMQENGTRLVAWSPLGSGFLTGTVKAVDSHDFRQNNPRFSQENLTGNLDRLEPVKKLAESLGVTPAQLALAWLITRIPLAYAIPGTRKLSRLGENFDALKIALPPEIMGTLNELSRDMARGGTLV